MREQRHAKTIVPPLRLSRQKTNQLPHSSDATEPL